MKEVYTVRAIIEILGAPAEHFQTAFNLVEQKLKEHTLLRRVTTKMFPVKEAPVRNEAGKEIASSTQKKLWTTFCECEFDVEDLDVLFGFCFDFMPSSIEIVKPETMKFDVTKMNNLLNDLAARLHYYDMIVKQLRIRNMILEKNASGVASS